MLDRRLSFGSHVTAVARACNYTMRNLCITSAIYWRPSLLLHTCAALYCLGWTTATLCSWSPQQAVFRSYNAYRTLQLGSFLKRQDGRTPSHSSSDALWLPVRQRIEYKLRGHSYLQSALYLDTNLPHSSHQTQGRYATSPFFVTPVTAETDHRVSFRRPRLPLHRTFRLELSEQLHCR